MSEEDEYIVINMDTDSDDSISDDEDIQVSIYFQADIILDTSDEDSDDTDYEEEDDDDDDDEEEDDEEEEEEDDDDEDEDEDENHGVCTNVTVEPYIEDSDDSDEQQFELEPEVQPTVDQGDQENVQTQGPENLKRYNSDPVDFSLINKRRRTCPPNNFMILQDLFERTNIQVVQIHDTVSRMEQFWQETEMDERCGNCSEPACREGQGAHNYDNAEETLPEPEALARPEKLDDGLSIVSCIYNGGVQRINNVTSSDQLDVEEPPVLLQPVDPILVTDPNGIICPVIVGLEGNPVIVGIEDSAVIVELENMNPDTAEPFILVPANLEIPVLADTSHINNAVTIEPNFEEINGVQDIVNPPIFQSFDYFAMPGMEARAMLDVPAALEFNLENNPEMMNFPPPMGDDSVQQNSSSPAEPIPGSDIEEVVLLELPHKAEIIVDGCKQTIYYPALLGSVVPPDPETIAASMSSEFDIEKLVLVEMPVNAEDIVEESSQMQDNPIVPDGDEEAASAAFPVSSGIEMLNSEESDPWMINNNLHSLGNDGGQIISCPFSVHPGFVCHNVLPVEVLQTGPIPHLILQPVNCLTVMEDVTGEGYLGDPRRNIRILNAHLEIAKDKATPTYAAYYLLKVLVPEEILLHSSIDGSTPGCVPLDQNTIAAIREYLVTVFPDYDLSEHGETWNECLSSVNFLIKHVHAEPLNPVEGQRDQCHQLRLTTFLHDNYHEYELEESEYYWKLCVTAINNCFQTLRLNPKISLA